MGLQLATGLPVDPLRDLRSHRLRCGLRGFELRGCHHHLLHHELERAEATERAGHRCLQHVRHHRCGRRCLRARRLQLLPAGRLGCLLLERKITTTPATVFRADLVEPSRSHGVHRRPRRRTTRAGGSIGRSHRRQANSNGSLHLRDNRARNRQRGAGISPRYDPHHHRPDQSTRNKPAGGRFITGPPADGSSG